MSSYTPTTGDVGSVLRATAMYDDGEDEDKTAQEDSAHAVRQAPESNIPPTFPDQDLDYGSAFRPRRPGKWRRTRLRARMLAIPL